MPFPSFYRRDRAHVEIKKRFEAVVQGRRERGGEHDDLLHTFLHTKCVQRAYLTNTHSTTSNFIDCTNLTHIHLATPTSPTPTVPASN
jgi:hypothetical protein